jgi:hypothetical protein
MLSLVLAAPVQSSGPQTCPAMWTASDSKCFRFFDRKLSWPAAQASCLQLGSRLAYSASRAEHDLMIDLYRAESSVEGPWIGITDRDAEGVWKVLELAMMPCWLLVIQLKLTDDWLQTSSGEALSYQSWCSGEPNDYDTGEDCGRITGQACWNDLPCSRELPYMCEIPLRGSSAKQGLAPALHGRFQDAHRSWHLWLLELAPAAATAAHLRVRGPPSACSLVWEVEGAGLTADCQRMEAGTAVWLGRTGGSSGSDHMVPIDDVKWRLNYGEGTISPLGAEHLVLGFDGGNATHSCGAARLERSPWPLVLTRKGDGSAAIFKQLVKRWPLAMPGRACMRRACLPVCHRARERQQAALSLHARVHAGVAPGVSGCAGVWLTL